MSFRATYYVTVAVDAPISAETFEQAVELAKKKTHDKLIKAKPGCEFNDWSVKLWQIWDDAERGGME